jgi:Myosin head (motor domain)/MyTH4 domain/RA like domain
MFQWLINRLNTSLVGPKPARFIGVLDIFGFEHFQTNSFEQFCINYTNEKLQQHFNMHIFKLEQQIYAEEGIAWADIEFVDNAEMLDLIEKKPLGIVSVLDEECRFPQATDDTLLQKMHQNYEDQPRYTAPRTSKTTFVLSHYAGDVEYEIFGWLDKNKDTVQDQIIGLLCNSKKPFVSDKVFGEEKAARAKAAEEAQPKAGAQGSLGGGASRRGGSKGNTVGAKFKEQLRLLMETLGKTMPHYVRCVKPNKSKEPMKWEDELVADQLRYAGMMETVRIRKLGYPVRFEFAAFAKRYRAICDPALIPAGDDDRALSQAIMTGEKFEVKTHYQMGSTRIFLRDEARISLEDSRNLAFGKKAAVIQARWRAFLERKNFLKLKAAVAMVSSRWRRIVQRRKYLWIVENLKIVQAFARMVPHRAHFKKASANASALQSLIRAVVVRRASDKLWEAEIERRRRVEEERRRREEEERKRKEEEERKRKEAEEAARAAEEAARQAEEAAIAAADEAERERLQKDAADAVAAAEAAKAAEEQQAAATAEAAKAAQLDQQAFEAAVEATTRPLPPPPMDGEALDDFPPPPDMSAFGLQGLDFAATDALLPPPPSDVHADAAADLASLKQAAEDEHMSELGGLDDLAGMLDSAAAAGDDDGGDFDGLQGLLALGSGDGDDDEALAALLADAGDLGDDVDDALGLMAGGFLDVMDDAESNPLDALAAQFGGIDEEDDEPATPPPVRGSSSADLGYTPMPEALDPMAMSPPSMVPPPLPDDALAFDDGAGIDAMALPPPPDLTALPPPPSLSGPARSQGVKRGKSSRRTLRKGKSSSSTMRGGKAVAVAPVDVVVDPEPTTFELDELQEYLCTAEEADMFRFSAFAEKHFGSTSFGRGAASQFAKKSSTYSDKQLRSPLLSELTAVKVVHAATEVWSKIGAFMHDKPSASSANDIASAFNVMSRGVAANFSGASEDQRLLVRDEILCQLVLQLSRHPVSSHALRGWCLMASCCAVFPPTKRFSKHLAAFFHGAAGRLDSSDALMTGAEPGDDGFCKKVRNWAVYCLSLLRQSVLRGARRFPLAKLEVKKVASLKPTRIQVKAGTAALEVDISPQTTASELISAVAEAAVGDAPVSENISDPAVGGALFMLTEVFNVDNKIVRRPLAGSHRLGDSLASAEEMKRMNRGGASVAVTFSLSPLVTPLHVTPEDPANSLASFDKWHDDTLAGSKLSLLRMWAEATCGEFQGGVLSALGCMSGSEIVPLSQAPENEAVEAGVTRLGGLYLQLLPSGAVAPVIGKQIPKALCDVAASHESKTLDWWHDQIQAVRLEELSSLTPTELGVSVLQTSAALFPQLVGAASLRGLALSGVSDPINALTGETSHVMTIRAISAKSAMKNVTIAVNLHGIHILPDMADPTVAEHVASLPLWRVRSCTVQDSSITISLVGGGVVALKFDDAVGTVGPPKAHDAASGVASAILAHLRYIAKTAIFAVAMASDDAHERGQVVEFTEASHGDHLALMLSREMAEGLSQNMPEEVTASAAKLAEVTAVASAQDDMDVSRMAEKQSVAPAAAWTFPIEELTEFAKEHGNAQALEDVEALATLNMAPRSRVATLRGTVRRKRASSIGGGGINTAEQAMSGGAAGGGGTWDALFKRRYAPINSALTHKAFASGQNKAACTMFQEILDYTMDDPSKRPIHARAAIGAAMRDESGALRDELFVQLARQVNPTPAGLRPEHIDDANVLVRGWELLALAAGCLDSSTKRLRDIIEGDLIHTAEEKHANPNIRSFAQVCALRRKEFRDTPAVNTRQMPPCNAEFMSVTSAMIHNFDSNSVLIRIATVEGTQKAIQIKPTTTVSEANRLLWSKFNVKPEMGFSLCGMTKHKKSQIFCPLPPLQRVCDSLASWDSSSHPQDLVFRRLVSWTKQGDETKFLQQQVADGSPDSLVGLQTAAHSIMWDLRHERIACSDSEWTYNIALMLASTGATPSQDVVTPERVLPMLPASWQKRFKKKDAGRKFCAEVLDLMTSEPSADGVKGMSQAECLAELVDTTTTDGQTNGSAAYVFAGLTVASSKNASSAIRSLHRNEAWLVLNHQGISICQPSKVHTGDVDAKKGCVFFTPWNSLGTDQGTISQGDETVVGGDGGYGRSKNSQFYFTCGSIQKPEKYVFSGTNSRFVQWLFTKLKDAAEGVGQGDARGRTGALRDMERQFKSLMC